MKNRTGRFRHLLGIQTGTKAIGGPSSRSVCIVCAYVPRFSEHYVCGYHCALRVVVVVPEFHEKGVLVGVVVRRTKNDDSVGQIDVVVIVRRM